jgi:hypothetical protein
MLEDGSYAKIPIFEEALLICVEIKQYEGV